MLFRRPARVFQEVDDALGEKLSRVIWEGPEDVLTLTANAQPALMAVSLAALRALEARGFSLKDKVAYVAGHSLGEYSALAAAGTFSVADAARLLRIRGNAMQAAVPVGEGAMAAIIGLDQADVEAACAEAAQGLGLPDRQRQWRRPAGDLRRQGGGRARRQAVHREGRQARHHAAGFGALPFGADAAGRRRHARGAGHGRQSRRRSCRSWPMSRSQPISDPEEIAALLVEQVTGRVRWRETVEWFGANGVTTLYEIGAGKVLSGLARRIDATSRTAAVGNPADIEAALAALGLIMRSTVPLVRKSCRTRRNKHV